MCQILPFESVQKCRKGRCNLGFTLRNLDSLFAGSVAGSTTWPQGLLPQCLFAAVAYIGLKSMHNIGLLICFKRILWLPGIYAYKYHTPLSLRKSFSSVVLRPDVKWLWWLWVLHVLWPIMQRIRCNCPKKMCHICCWAGKEPLKKT